MCVYKGALNFTQDATLRPSLVLHPASQAHFLNMRRASFFYCFLIFILSVRSIPFERFLRGKYPVVSLPYGAFEGSTSGNTSSFLGMPFAEPPYVFATAIVRTYVLTFPPCYRVGDLRFAPPVPPQPWLGVRNATTYGAACLQQNTSIGGAGQLPFTLPSFTYPIANVTPIQQQSEDCMTLSSSFVFGTDTHISH